MSDFMGPRVMVSETTTSGIQPVKETLDAIIAKLEETDNILVTIIGGLAGGNDREANEVREACCMQEAMNNANKMAERCMLKAQKVREYLF